MEGKTTYSYAGRMAEVERIFTSPAGVLVYLLKVGTGLIATCWLDPKLKIWTPEYGWRTTKRIGTHGRTA